MHTTDHGSRVCGSRVYWHRESETMGRNQMEELLI
jgi:hypothetical protein